MAAVEGAVRAGAATQDLYSQYGRQVYAYCLHRLRSREEAEDAVQTTFMNAFRSLQRGATTQFEQAWLFKIAQNVCFARSASASRRLRLEAPNDFEVLQEIVPSHEGEQPLELIGLEDALEQMPENQRRAILLREWQGLSYREIGEQLELTQAAVEMLIFRARRALAGALEQPEEVRGKKLRTGRRVSALASLLVGVVKTLFGGGAAIKAVSIAAAAIAVIGESANHTIVRHTAAASAAGVAAQASALPASRARAAVRGAPGAMGSPSRDVVVRPAARHPFESAAKAPSGTATHAHGTTPALTDASPTITAPASPPVPAPPAPVPAAPLPAPAPAAAPKDDDRRPTSVVPPPSVTPPAPVVQQPVVQQPVETEPVPPPPPAVAAVPQDIPGNNGNGFGHDKQKDAQPAPAPVVTVTPAAAPVAPEAATAPPAPPAPGDHGNGHGNGNGNANGRGHDK